MSGSNPDHSNDVAFAQAWDRWFQEHPQHDVPPALVVVTGIDRPDFGGGWKTPGDGIVGAELRESLIRAQFDSLRSLLPITFQDYAAVGLGDDSPAGVIEHVVPALSPLLLKAERTALLRRLHEVAGQSRVGRLVHQIGQHGRSLWSNLRSRRKATSAPP